VPPDAAGARSGWAALGDGGRGLDECPSGGGAKADKSQPHKPLRGHTRESGGRSGLPLHKTMLVYVWWCDQLEECGDSETVAAGVWRCAISCDRTREWAAQHFSRRRRHRPGCVSQCAGGELLLALQLDASRLHLLELARYVVLNPVRAGMVAAPGDWLWSSYRATVGEAPTPGPLEVDWVLRACAEEYRSGGRLPALRCRRWLADLRRARLPPLPAGRFVGLLPTKDGEEARTVLH